MSRKIRNKDLVESISKVDDRVLSLLSPQFYLDSYTEVQLANQTPEEHFIGSGFPKGLNPCALFDSKWYRDRYNLPAEEHCLAHYLFNGHRLGNEPSPYFNSVFYRSNAKDIPSDISPLEHFRDVGWKRLLDVHPLFDTAWYLDQLSEPLEIGVIPIEHFISLGRNSGHSPSPMFNSDSYYRMNPELAYADVDALCHYLCWGRSEGRLISEFIDEDWYQNQSPDDPLVGSWGTAGHFARLGCFEGRTIHPDPMAHRLLKYACDRSRRLRDHLQLDGYGETSSNPFNLEKRAQSLILQTSDGPKVSVIIPTFNHFKDVVACLETISLAGDETPFEVIIVDDCSSPHESQGLSSIPGIRYLRHESNQGFAAACTTGVNASSAEFILLLNNDTEVFPGWLDSLASEMDLHEKTGVVGSMIIRPSLFLQEAGCIIWSDGTGAHHGSGDNPCEIKYRFRRQVDYCSGACLLIRRNLWDAIGGFDEDLAPAYYEDTDLCFAVRDHGFDVIYQPNSLVLHREGSSHGSAPLGLKRVQFRNRHKFVKKWESQLSQHSPNEGLLSVVDSLLRQERHFSKHILIIDHFVLTPDQDSGSVRMSRMIEEFVSMGYRVHFGAIRGQHSPKWLSQVCHLGVEVVVGVEAIKPLVAGLKDQLDFVILSRPEVFAEMISVMWLLAPAVPVAYDMVDAHGLRLRRKYEMSKLPVDLESAEYIELVEIKSAKAADVVIGVSQADLEHLRNVSENMFKGVIIPNVHYPIKMSTKGFDDRKGILFVGGFQHDPNVAAVKELVNVIMPKVWDVLGPIPVTIAGSKPTAEVLELASRDVRVRGWVEDLGPVYEQSRLVVAPLRYGAGVKGKIGEALIHGLPTVTTSIGVEGLALENKMDIMIADSPDEIAKIICDLYNDKESWLKLQENGAKKIEQLMGRTALRGYLDNLVISLTADNQQLSGASRLAEISQFVEAINALPNPFIYGILYSREDHPDIPVHIVPQFAQRGEDLIVDSLRRVLIRKIGDPNTRFTYLEIGANHPVAGSSTFLFYANGNRGTLVEANPRLIPSLRNSRPDDKIIEAAVVPGHIETVDLFVANRSELSSLRSDIAETFEGAEVVERLIVPAINVNELISTMWDPQAITFLSIDVEGLDFEILEAVNLENFPFDIIQIEASDNLIHGNSRRIAGYLERSGYQFVNETEVHLIFVAGDSLQLRKRQGLSSAENLASFGKVNFDSKYASHDLFDTLIARRGVTADSALIRLREKYGSLVDQRIALDNGERSLSQMYAEAGLPDDMLEEEIRLEVDECIPIVKNIERVQDGDLIISDTYFSREVLQQLLKKAGIKKRVGLYSSNLDKYQGKVWSRLSSLPRLHVGDNEHSDIHMAEQSGVATLLVQNFCLSDWETTIEEFSVPLARFLREIRLRCSSTKYSTWQRAQQEFNVLMMLSAAVLVKKLDREPVFLGRDCQQLSKIYRSLYGVGSYLPFSRRFAYDSDTASRYLLENVDSKQVIVDLVSTGRTWSLLSIPRDVHVMIESDDYQYSGELSRPERFSSEFKTSKIGPTSLIWEVLNCADHGMALGAGDLNLGWVRFAERELPLEFVRSMHEVTDSMVASLEHFEIDELIPDPEVIFLLAHNRLVEFVDNHREVFDSIRLTEIENIADLRGSSSE